MKTKRLVVLVGMLGLAGFALAGRGEKAVLVLPKEISYNMNDEKVNSYIDQLCKPTESIPKAMKKLKKSDAYDKVVYERPESGSYDVLAMDILLIMEKQVGSYTPVRRLILRVTLYDHKGQAKAGALAYRRTIQKYGDRCDIFDKVFKAVRKDLSKWLESPADGVVLGDPIDKAAIRFDYLDELFRAPFPYAESAKEEDSDMMEGLGQID